MDEVKLCRDCRHKERGILVFLTGYPRCKSPKIPMKIDAVTGRKEPVYKFCSTIRDCRDADQCGPTARWWEPREAMSQAMADALIAERAK